MKEMDGAQTGTRATDTHRLNHVHNHHIVQMLLRDFDVSVPPGTDKATFLEPKQMLTLAPAHGSRLVFRRRSRHRRR